MSNLPIEIDQELFDRYELIKTESDLKELLVGQRPQRFKNFRLIETKGEFQRTRHEFSLDFLEYRLKQEYVKAVRFRPALIRPPQSPRAWRKSKAKIEKIKRKRFISTCVEKMPYQIWQRLHLAVHLHVRGENTASKCRCTDSFGSSPRAWRKFRLKRA